MSEIDFMSVLHKSTKRDYLARVNDKEYPKARAAEIAKKFEYEKLKIKNQQNNIIIFMLLLIILLLIILN